MWSMTRVGTGRRCFSKFQAELLVDCVEERDRRESFHAVPWAGDRLRGFKLILCWHAVDVVDDEGVGGDFLRHELEAELLL